VDERIVAFDAMGTLFDTAPVAERFGQDALPRVLHRAAALTLAGAFAPFPELVEAVLGPEALETFAQLDAFPDAASALDVLDGAGIRAVVLTNGSHRNTETLLERNGLRGRFAEILTTEEVRAYKPHPAPYGLVAERLGVPPERTVLVASHDWDVLGASRAGRRAIRVRSEWWLPGEPPATAPSLVAAAEAAAA
jgi:2-haloacid dehalogenase